MPEAMTELERMRQQLNLLLGRVDKLSDPELLELAQQMDRLIVEEMRERACPPERTSAAG